MAVVSLGGREELLLLETFLFPKDNILDDVVWLIFRVSY